VTYLESRPAIQHSLLVHAPRQALGVPLALPIREKDIGVLLGNLMHPGWDRDISVVTDVAPTLVEGHDHLDNKYCIENDGL
jgi:hypothetical protein